ncbi:hypothetical protein PC110_g19606 [Phytophthora cactorum]|uniref:Uncharacterized protein n=1 Tax=Phytophthora cactorum TaxID=29920 RepID=A0A329RKV6_9STRA|nr:hypothetical protein PC110_g19606 [Phytophthora cactorum]
MAKLATSWREATAVSTIIGFLCAETWVISHTCLMNAETDACNSRSRRTSALICPCHGKWWMPQGEWRYPRYASSRSWSDFGPSACLRSDGATPPYRAAKDRPTENRFGRVPSFDEVSASIATVDS